MSDNAASYLARVDVERCGDMFNDLFDDKRTLRRSEATECRVGREIGLTEEATYEDASQLVGVVQGEDRSLENLSITARQSQTAGWQLVLVTTLGPDDETRMSASIITAVSGKWRHKTVRPLNVA